MEAAAPGATAAAERPFTWRFVTPVVVASTLNPVNSSVIATALVPIAAGIHVTVGRTAVLVSALYLATAIGQPTAGKLSEQIGPRRVFLAGVLAVVVGAVVGGTGSNLATLAVARFLIGVGTSTSYPASMLLVRRRAAQAGLAAPPGGVLGGIVIAGTVSAAAGLPLGGVLVGAWGWRASFLASVPLAILSLAAGWRWIPAVPPGGPGSLRELARRIDLAGLGAFAATLAALLVFLLSLPEPDWPALVATAIAAGALVSWELRAATPFFDVRMLVRHLALTRTYLRQALSTLCIYMVLYALTQWLEAARHVSTRQAGLLLLPMTGVAALLAQPVSRRNLVRLPLVAAALSCLAGSVGVALLATSTPVVAIVAVTLVFGVTLSTTMTGNQTALYTQVEAERIGTASGLLRTFGYLGSIASSAIISVVFHTRVADHGLHVIGWTMVGVSVAGIVLLFTDRALLRPAAARGRVASGVPPHPAGVP
jgi:predicted MFS family arabinose efflux permease